MRQVIFHFEDGQIVKNRYSFLYIHCIVQFSDALQNRYISILIFVDDVDM